MSRRGFVAGTRLHGPAGFAPIESIRVGDPVLTRDAASGGVTQRVVVRVHRLPEQDVLLVRLHPDGPGDDNLRMDSLAVPADQLFRVDGGPGKLWRRGGQLEDDDRIPVATGTDARVLCSDPVVAWTWIRARLASAATDRPTGAPTVSLAAHATASAPAGCRRRRSIG